MTTRQYARLVCISGIGLDRLKICYALHAHDQGDIELCRTGNLRAVQLLASKVPATSVSRSMKV